MRATKSVAVLLLCALAMASARHLNDFLSDGATSFQNNVAKPFQEKIVQPVQQKIVQPVQQNVVKPINNAYDKNIGDPAKKIINGNSGTTFSGGTSIKAPDGKAVEQKYNEGTRSGEKSWNQAKTGATQTVSDMGNAEKLKQQAQSSAAGQLGESLKNKVNDVGDHNPAVQKMINTADQTYQKGQTEFDKFKNCQGTASCTGVLIEGAKAMNAPVANAVVENVCSDPLASFLEGGWQQGGVGSKIWAGQGVANIVLAVFPGTQAAALQMVLDEIRKQGSQLMNTFSEMAAKIPGQMFNLESEISEMLTALLQGKSPPTPKMPGLDLKMAVLQSKCGTNTLKIGTNQPMDSEGNRGDASPGRCRIWCVNRGVEWHKRGRILRSYVRVGLGKVAARVGVACMGVRGERGGVVRHKKATRATPFVSPTTQAHPTPPNKQLIYRDNVALCVRRRAEGSRRTKIDSTSVRTHWDAHQKTPPNDESRPFFAVLAPFAKAPFFVHSFTALD